MIGFAVCGSFCNRENTLNAAHALCEAGYSLLPILSEKTATTDTRFGTAESFRVMIESICKRDSFVSISQSETISNANRLDLLVVCPCTGNTLSKLACGISDGAVTLAVKAHARNGGKTVIALASNDALSGSFVSVAKLYNRKNFFFVPLAQDDPINKATSLVCDFTLLQKTVEAAFEGKQLQPFIM